MIKERSEVVAFSRDDIERIVRYIAKQQLGGGVFIGKFGDQSVRWDADGGIEVITKYQEGDFTDVETKPASLQVADQKKKRK
jgi:hypothetical protein